MIERPLRFDTPVILGGKFYGNLFIKGTAVSFDDSDSFITYAIESTRHFDSDRNEIEIDKTVMLKWVMETDLDKIITKHCKDYVFLDMAKDIAA